MKRMRVVEGRSEVGEAIEGEGGRQISTRPRKIRKGGAHFLVVM